MSSWDYATAIPEENLSSSIFYSILKGLQFDFTICFYFLALPVLFFLIEIIVGKGIQILRRISYYFILFIFPLLFLIAAVDISFFNQTYQRLNRAAFIWTDQSDTMLGMIFQEFSFYWPIIPWLIITAGFTYVLIRFNRPLQRSTIEKKSTSIPIRIIVFVLTAAVTFMGIRGGQIKYPINLNAAEISIYSYPNQICMNPVFSLFTSFANSSDEEKISLIDPKEALTFVNKEHGVLDSKYNSPIARDITFEEETNKMNVVLILMEGLSADKIGPSENGMSLTPNLDYYAQEGISFDNFYSSGIHTYSGIYSTLTGFPTIMGQHGMNNPERPKYNGLPETLKDHGYETSFFMCSHGEWDNMSPFLLNNGFETVITEAEYPSDAHRSSLGVADEIMFNYSLEHLKRYSDANSNFLATYMTGSNHGPFYIPSHFIPESSIIEDQIIEYSDWAIGDFMDKAKDEEWYDNTIFIFVSDHGRPVNVKYDMPISNNHIPCIIYGKSIDRFQNKEFGSQIDLFPTIMDLLKLDYIQNSFGQSLLSNHQNSTFFVSDDRYASINDSLYLIIDHKGTERLYNYKKSDMNNLINQYPEIANKMKVRVDSYLQSAQEIIINKQTYIITH